MTPREYAVEKGLLDYVNLIDEITIDYILNVRSFRMQLALNGFDFGADYLTIVMETYSNCLFEKKFKIYIF